MTARAFRLGVSLAFMAGMVGLALAKPGPTPPGGGGCTNNCTFTGTTAVAALTVDGDAISGVNSGDVTLGAVGSSPNGNGASLSGQALTLQPANSTNPGVVTTGSQTWAGFKAFSSALSASGGVAIGTSGTTIASSRSNGVGGTELDFGSIGDGACADLTAAVTSAVVNSAVALGYGASPPDGFVFGAWISASGTATVRACNLSGGAVDPGSLTFFIRTLKD